SWEWKAEGGWPALFDPESVKVRVQDFDEEHDALALKVFEARAVLELHHMVDAVPVDRYTVLARKAWQYILLQEMRRQALDSVLQRRDGLVLRDANADPTTR